MKTLFNFLIHYFLFFGTVFFAAAPVVVGDVAAEPVADASVDDTPSDDTPADDAGGEVTPAEGAEEDKTVTPTGQKTDAKLDGRTMPPKVREMMDQLKVADPKQHAWLKDRLFENRAMKQEFPGGLKEMQAMKAEAAAFKKEFPNGVEAVRSELSEWRALDEAYLNADPKAIDVWIEADKNAFTKLMPTAISRFFSVDNDAAQRHFSGMILGSMQAAGVFASLHYLDRAVKAGDKEGGLQLLADINKFIQELDTAAKSKPKQDQQNPALDSREQALSQREEKLFIRDAATEINSEKSALIRKELAQYLNGQQVDDETYGAMEREIHRHLDQLLTADPTFTNTFNSYVENKDKEGLKQFMLSKVRELLPSKNGKPGPTEKAYKLFFRGPVTKPKPKPPAGAKPNGNTPPPPQGWTKVTTAPNIKDIDMNASPFEMRFNKAAVLKGSGKKVFWGDKPPAQS